MRCRASPNTGNQLLPQAVFENELPGQGDYTRFFTGAFSLAAIGENLSASYSIDYETAGGGGGTLGPYSTDVSTAVDLSDVLAPGDNLSLLRWNLTALGVGVKSHVSPSLFGTIKSDTPINSSLLNHIHLTFSEQGTQSERIQNFSTIIDDICVLRPSLSWTGGNNTPVRPGERFSVQLRASCVSSRLHNPILAVLLPRELTFVGNVSASYSDVFTTIDPTLPPAFVQQNFTAQGQTLVRFSFTGDYAFSFYQLANIRINFDVAVAVGALGEISAFSLLDTSQSTGIIPPEVDVYLDNDDIAGTGQSAQAYAKSNTTRKTILFFVSTRSDKKVKGALDSDWLEEPAVGQTVEGGTLQYLITLQNIGNADLLDTQIVDILPHLGDTGVLNPDTPRQSAFSVYTISDISATHLPQNTDVGLQLAYSTSTDPVRFGPNFDVIGTDDNWQDTPPEDLSTLRAFRVRADGLVLRPGEGLQVLLNAAVPVGVQPGQVAWNSFAADVAYLDLSDTKQHLLAIEPEKVGIAITEPPSDTVQIGGFAFFDSNGDGLARESDPRLNDVGVALFDAQGSMVAARFTAPDAAGNDGYYLFTNVPQGQYFVRFFIDERLYSFTTPRVDDALGSKADRRSGTTQLLDLRTVSRRDDIHVGLLERGTVPLASILKINRQARAMVRDVVKNQMLLTMKQEDVLTLLEQDLFERR